MRIIISPAKKMNTDDSLPFHDLPCFLAQAEELKQYMQGLSYEEAKTLWKCNDRLADLNFKRFACMNLHRNLTPAILSYEGIQYQYMAPGVFETESMTYIQDHLRILSGFYGVLRPFDGITPYRLEMQAKAAVSGTKDLYAFWGDRLYHAVTSDDHSILNLASKEYSRCIEAYLTPEDTNITCVFGEFLNGKVMQKATLAKMARGEMVRFLADHHIDEPKGAKQFDRLGFRFHEELSSETEYVFLKDAE